MNTFATVSEVDERQARLEWFQRARERFDRTYVPLEDGQPAAYIPSWRGWGSHQTGEGFNLILLNEENNLAPNPMAGPLDVRALPRTPPRDRRIGLVVGVGDR